MTTGRQNRQTLFCRILPTTVRDLTSTTPVDWHLKVKDVECNVGTTKNYYITISMQKLSSTHILIFKILQNLGTHKSNGHAHFWLCSLKLSEITFSLSEFPPAGKNQFIPSIHSWDTVNFRVLSPDWPHPFLTIPAKKCMWICINMQKIRIFHWFVLETWLIKKSCNLIGWEHIGLCLRNKIF